MTVHNAWFDANFVVKEVVFEQGKVKGSGKILGSYDRSLMLPGAIDSGGGKRDFWVWQDAIDRYINLKFDDTLFVTDPDGRSGKVALRQSKGVMLSLLPREK
jgi:hypothetical protein